MPVTRRAGRATGPGASLTRGERPGDLANQPPEGWAGERLSKPVEASRLPTAPRPAPASIGSLYLFDKATSFPVSNAQTETFVSKVLPAS